MAAASSIVKRACDACHRRKVKCIGDGTIPCSNCKSSGLSCTYNSVPQKKGPKGSRAKVLSELRTQQHSQLAFTNLDSHSPSISPTFGRARKNLPNDLVVVCVDYFLNNMYGTQPILDRQSLGELVSQMDTDLEASCLVVSFCGYMLIQPMLELPASILTQIGMLSASNAELGYLLIQEALATRKGIDYQERPSLVSVLTSFFLFGGHFCLGKHNAAWFHLREATTMALSTEMHDEASYQALDPYTAERRRRLFWLLFVTERAYALQKHRPLSLHPTINLPTRQAVSPEQDQLTGFLHLVELFRPFDDTFVALWNKTQNACSSQWVQRLQEQLTSALPTYLRSTECQAVDLRVSQQWLRTLAWQLSIRHGFLSSAAAERAMRFDFPIEISRDLLSVACDFSTEAMETHGIGLVEKLFDICYVLIDVISCIPRDPSRLEYGPREYLHQLMSLISGLRGGQQRYMPVLVAKIQDTTPASPYSSTGIAAIEWQGQVDEASHFSTPPSQSSMALSIDSGEI